ncbi:lysine N(6)-hydroxylase/L-ornithine N(5)-oxygenase family protein [Halobacillus rhizosphaerae]|uniref:lysine N(6)-hydroxylase/L-ornithine N(5)-oxygenase family protein n=1 Tax=Halobacillus rhizosphaerae TaxID=3064889 RepID=UPI00398B3827
MNPSIYPSGDVFDVIGIGIGPFNLGMAALLESVPEIHSLFLEKESDFQWHPNMMIEGTTLQVPFLADLVSMADVKNEYSFLNYLQEHNRLYQFYFLEKFHIPRKEYNHYCQWVSERLSSCRFGRDVRGIIPIEVEGRTLYQVTAKNVETDEVEQYITKHVVMGIGTVPFVPEPFREYLGSTVCHTSDYLGKKQEWGRDQSVVVIGSGQSAAEVFLDVAKTQKEGKGNLQWYTRSKGFFPMEYSKLGLEYFSPDYTDFFYPLPQSKKDKLIQDQDLLYKGISAETIAQIYDHLYEQSIGNVSPNILLQAMTEMTSIYKTDTGWRLDGFHRLKEEKVAADTDIVVLGTGYRPALPDFLSKLEEWIPKDEHKRYFIKKDYSLENQIHAEGKIFVQNGELHTHGVGAPDLGLGAYRNAVIINQMAGREVYPVHSKNVFQTFGVNDADKHSYVTS